MPTYEYACSSCGNTWEEVQKITEPALDTCPACKKATAKRQISGGSFILKGGGWYADAYSSTPKGSSSKGGEASSSKSGDSGGSSAESKGTSDSGGSKSETKSESSAPSGGASPSGGSSGGSGPAKAAAQ